MDQKKRYINDNINYLDQKSLEDIMNIISSHDETKLSQCSDGVRVAYDSLPPLVIEHIYNLIKYKMSNNKKKN
jgi:hypothetical protein